MVEVWVLIATFVAGYPPYYAVYASRNDCAAQVARFAKYASLAEAYCTARVVVPASTTRDDR